MFSKTLHISTSPHLHKGSRTDVIMWHVVGALMPLVVFAFSAFGWDALLVITTTAIFSIGTEHVLCKISRQKSTIADSSALITGILLGLTLPPSFPLWMAALGGVFSIGLGKFVFGGLGHNPFNPALVGRAFLQAAFPVAITTWTPAFYSGRFTTLSASVLTFPFGTPTYDGISGATPLTAFKFDHITSPTNDLIFGFTNGSAGETSGLLILIGGIYLISKGMMNWRIPMSILMTVGIFSSILYAIDPAQYPAPAFMLFSGGLMLGAVFMASDMVGSPMTNKGIYFYGLIIGVLVVSIRIWGGLPEGVMYAILLGNAITPQLDRFIKPRTYGTKK